VVADAVEGLGAEVERFQRDVGTPYRVVVTARYVWREGVFAGVATRAVAAVVTDSDRLGQRHVEPESASDRRGHLGDLESMREPCSLVIVGEDEDLGLSGEAPEGAGVQDAIAVSFEACPPRIGLLLDGALARTESTCGQ
jgi:hypothetical protein